MQRTIIAHAEHGIYLGNFMGLGFFSKLDAAGQPSAATFEDEGQARAHVVSWDSNNNPDGYIYRPVNAAADLYASVPELDAAGLSDLIGDEMRANHVRESAAA
jgi:hypothetical protein